MCFTEEDAKFMVDQLDEILTGLSTDFEDASLPPTPMPPILIPNLVIRDCVSCYS